MRGRQSAQSRHAQSRLPDARVEHGHIEKSDAGVTGADRKAASARRIKVRW